MLRIKLEFFAREKDDRGYWRETDQQTLLEGVVDSFEERGVLMNLLGTRLSRPEVIPQIDPKEIDRLLGRQGF